MKNRIYNTLIILGFATFLSINTTNITGAEIQKVTQDKNTIEQQIKSQLIPFNKFYTSELEINIPISEPHIEDIKETEQIENADINSKINKEENEETIKESTKNKCVFRSLKKIVNYQIFKKIFTGFS